MDNSNPVPANRPIKDRALAAGSPADKSKPPVGDTVVASMQKERGDSQSSSVSQSVLKILQQVVEGLGASASVVQIVRSLIWPFVLRRSSKEEYFPPKEFGRFISSFRATAKRIMAQSVVVDREQSFCKYWLDRYMCQVFGDHQLPDRPDWLDTPLFSGWCRRFVLRAIARRDVSFIYSLQKGSKQAWFSLSDESKELALQRHADRLSTVRSSLPDDLRLMIIRTSREVFSKDISSAESQGKWKKFLPSTSACLQASRRNGGAMSLAERFNLDPESEDSEVLGKLPALNLALNSWRQSVFDDMSNHLSLRLDDFDEKGFSPALDVDIVAIPEPGKFRIISKGDGYLYSILQPYQGVLLAAWKKHYASTMTIDLDARVKDMDLDCGVFPFWCSGDYEAATDLLKREATWEALSCLPDSSFKSLSLQSMCSGRARYPNGRKVHIFEGQLMGHPLSFPLLCVINLAVYRCAINRWVEETGDVRSGRAMWRNVSVNGDDILFKVPSVRFFEIFNSTARDAGFKASQGKNYLSKDCCLINSQLYRRVSGSMKRFGYLNQRILLGTNIKLGEKLSTPTQIGREVNEMVRLCPWTRAGISQCFSRWSRDFYGSFYRPNWFLPVHLGGFGVDPSYATKYRVTRGQRELAARFLQNPTLALYRHLGMDVPSAKFAGALANWRMVPGDYVPLEGESSGNEDEWLQRIAYAALAHKARAETADKVLISRLHRSTDRRPSKMSVEDIELYRKVQFFAYDTPFCPPIGNLRYMFGYLG